MSSIVKEIMVRIVGDSRKVKETYDDVIKDSQKFGKEIEKNGVSLQALGKISMAAGGAVLGVMAATVIAASNTAGEIDHLSKTAGISAESFQRLAYAAKQDDVDMQGLAVGIVKLTKSMSDAANGGKETQAAFQAIGVNVQTAGGQLRSADAVLLDVAERFAQMPNPAEKTALALQLFGKSGADLVPFLSQGKEGIRALGEEAEKLGLVISETAIGNLDAFGDNLEAIKSSVGGFGNQIASDLSPAFLTLSEGLKNALEFFHSIPGPVREVITVSAALAAAVALVGGACIVLGPAIGAALSPLWPFIAAAALLGGLALIIAKNWDYVRAFFEVAFAKALAVAQIALSSFKIYVLAEALAIVKGFELLTSWIPGFGDKVKAASQALQNMISDETVNINNNRQKLIENDYDQHLKRIQSEHKNHSETEKRQTQQETGDERDIRLKSQEEMLKKRQEFNAEWERKAKEAAAEDTRILKDQVKLRLDTLNAAMQEDLKKARELGASQASVYQYYAEQEKQIRAAAQKQIDDFNRQASQKLIQENIQTLNRIANDRTKSYAERRKAEKEAIALRIQLLEDEKQQELQKAEELGADKQAILDAYAAKEKAVYDGVSQKHKDAYMAMAQTLQGYADQMRTGQKTLKDILKENIINQLNALEQPMIAHILAGIADAWAQAPWTFGASLAWIPGLLSAQGAGIAAIELAKSVIGGLAEGGLATGPSLQVIGEGRYPEAVLPLSTAVFKKLAEGIVGQIPKVQAAQPQPSGNSSSTVILQVGTLIGDDLSLRKLQRKLNDFQNLDNRRRGLKE
jgi:AcrR family transcriptional regulator